MVYDFNAQDVLEMAEQIESNGAEFYTKAATEIEDAETKDLLNKLAAMEENHKQIFTEMRAELTEREKESTIFDPYNESALYLKALADTRVFFEKKIDTSSAEAIFMDAITAEKDSIAFYLGMKEAVPEDLGKQKIDWIIQEEMTHIRILSQALLACKPE